MFLFSKRKEYLCAVCENNNRTTLTKRPKRRTHYPKEGKK